MRRKGGCFLRAAAVRGLAIAAAAVSFAAPTAPLSTETAQRDGELLVSDNITALGSIASRDALLSPNAKRLSFLSGKSGTAQEGLPYTVVGIGAQKCGTTFLWKVLRQHPDVFADRKETRWFSKPGESHCKYHPRVLGASNFSVQSALGQNCTSVVPAGVTRSMYQRYIDKCFCGRLPQGNQTLLDVSPGYSRKEHKMAIHNMKKMQADTVFRFIMIVRDPVERLISEVNMRRKNGVTRVDDDELLRIIGKDIDEIGASTVKGEYHEAVERWLFHFGKESLLVINMAELDNLETWRRILRHTGLQRLPDATIQEMIDVAQSEYRTKQRRKKVDNSFKPLEVPVWMRDKLVNHYAPFNEKLWQLLGTRWW